MKHALISVIIWSICIGMNLQHSIRSFSEGQSGYGIAWLFVVLLNVLCVWANASRVLKGERW